MNLREGPIMKLTIIKKATTTKKPANYCPWLLEDIPVDIKK